MNLRAFLSAQRRRTALAVLLVPVTAAPAISQALHPSPSAASPQVAAPQGPPIQKIVVHGTQRIEPATVMSYLLVHVGDAYDEQTVDRSLKSLFSTGLFADVKFGWDGGTLTINVVENPIINQVQFEGNDKVSEKDLTKEVQLKPRTVFTRAKVQADVQRIIELYRRNGKFAATVDPQIIQRPQNRVDLIFSINEGPTTGVARITFIGNKIFGDDTLRSQIATETSAWWKFLASNDNYDPDRLTFDREQLRRFYLKQGYADFRVVSAVAELTPDRENFYITFTVDEGRLYHFGTVVINSKIRELSPRVLRPLVPIRNGSVYDAELVDKSLDVLTNAAGGKGYAFAQVHPRIRRNRENRTIDVIFDVEQGARVYIEKINITGNTRTLDKVIRREFRLVEGDAFNRTLVDRSRTRIKSLGFFKDVDVKAAPGSQPDRTVLNVGVTEQSTGELSVGAGYSSLSSFVGQLSYTERNLFGRGQYLRASVELSGYYKQAQLSFTEPYFLDRPVAAGIDLYKTITYIPQANYQGDTTGFGLRFGFPTSEYGAVGIRYSFTLQRLTPFANAGSAIQLAAGSWDTSSIGYSYNYNTLDDPIKPRHGFTFGFSQDFAGFGGNLKYIKTETSFATFRPIFWDKFVASFRESAGYIQGYDGQSVILTDRFFKGGDSFRGFALAGVGPRELNVPNNDAVGGDAYAIGSLELRIPDYLPADYGISSSLFTDFGTVGHIDSGTNLPGTTSSSLPCVKGSGIPCIRDNMAFRMTAGLAIAWKSPFGPVQIDLALPIVKESYDQPRIIWFSAGTGL
jgi:outer membrane protein insertion porin family